MNNTHSSNNNRSNNNGNNSQFKQNLGYEARWGYLHSVREMPHVKPTVLCVKIDVPYGRNNQGKALYENFDLIVKSADAFSLFTHYFDTVNDESNKVTVRFSTYGNKAKAYIAGAGKREGEAIPYIAGKLGHLFNMRINGSFVFGGNDSDSVSEDDQSFDDADLSSLEEHERLLSEAGNDASNNGVDFSSPDFDVESDKKDAAKKGAKTEKKTSKKKQAA